MPRNMCSERISSRTGHPYRVDVRDMGRIRYAEMLNIQRELFSEMTERKKRGEATENETLFIVEHEPVITLGRHAHRENLLLPEEVLNARGIEVHAIERGGDITYHGPGQLVVYPLIDLEKHHLGVKDYVDILEEAVILTIAEYGIKGERVEGASGVWIGVGTPRERKICALGIKCSRFVTMHGLALNVNTEMDGFSLINPCGFTDKGVTSMRLETGRTSLSLPEVAATLTRHLLSLL